jgi:homoserine kinase type II
VGRALARLHTAGLDLAGRFNRSGIYTFENIVERLRGFADTQDPELVDAVALLLDEAQWLSARQPIRDRARRGIIHGDLFRDNVMFAGDVVVGLIDFEQASVGSLAYDLAVTINDWCFSDGFEPDRIDALLDGYRETGTVTPADHAALQVELRAAAMRFAVTRITDVYLPGVDLPDKDFRRYVGRLLALRAGT